MLQVSALACASLHVGGTKPHTNPSSLPQYVTCVHSGERIFISVHLDIFARNWPRDNAPTYTSYNCAPLREIGLELQGCGLQAAPQECQNARNMSRSIRFPLNMCCLGSTTHTLQSIQILRKQISARVAHLSLNKCSKKGNTSARVNKRKAGKQGFAKKNTVWGSRTGSSEATCPTGLIHIAPFRRNGCVKTHKTPGEHRNRWQVNDPPQNGAIGRLVIL